VLTPLVVSSNLRRVADLLSDDQRRQLRVDLIEMERCRRRAAAWAANYVIGAAPTSTSEEADRG
jgi:hypothetical protein